jgi:Holliday junction resolvasome RuvABC endonuclease subunit
MVKLVLAVDVPSHHASDALAVAICHATAPRAVLA